MSRTVVAVGLGVALYAGLPAQAAEGDAQAGKQKKQMCEGCHGVPGYRTAYPAVYSCAWLQMLT